MMYYETAGLPSVSVIMAARNGMPYLEAALRSLMVQTLRNIEIIVVDDASTDETPAVMARLALEDARIRTISLTEKHGLPRALNRGLDIARAPYVARLDADDLAHRHRLAFQKTWLDEHPDVQLLASSVRKINPAGKVITIEIRDLPAPVLRWRACFGMPIVHPTFMFRRLDPDGIPWRYDPDFPVAQDYDLLSRILARGEAVSLPDVLVDWRVHQDSISAQRLEQQRVLSQAISLRIRQREMEEDLEAEAGKIVSLLHHRTRATSMAALNAFKSMQKLLAPTILAHPELAEQLNGQAAALLTFAFGSQKMNPLYFRLLMRLGPREIAEGHRRYRLNYAEKRRDYLSQNA